MVNELEVIILQVESKHTIRCNLLSSLIFSNQGPYKLSLTNIFFFLENAEKLLNQDVDLDLPGSAQHYCIHCARYFIDDQALNEHFKTKVHKRRLKALELEPYSIEESERAAGLGSFKLPSKRKIETQTKPKSNITDEDGDAVLEEVSPSKKQKIDENAA